MRTMVNQDMQRARIIELIKDGRTLKEIAEDSGIHPENFRKRVFKDLFEGRSFNEVKDALYQEFFEQYIASVKTINEVQKGFFERFQEQFKSVDKDSFSNLFNRLYGVRIREYFECALLSDEKIIETVRACPSMSEFQESIGLWAERLDRLYSSHGVSSYHELRIKLLGNNNSFQKSNSRDKNLALLIGLLIGDGHMYPEKTVVAFEHKNDNLDYLILKVGVLNSIFPCTKSPSEIRPRRIDHSSGKTFHTNVYKSSTQSRTYHRKLKDAMYDADGRKTIRRELFDLMDEESVFFWYLDDGSMPINKKDRFRNNTIELCTDNFTKEENEIAAECFKERWSVNFSLKTIPLQHRLALRSTGISGQLFKR